MWYLTPKLTPVPPLNIFNNLSRFSCSLLLSSPLSEFLGLVSAIALSVHGNNQKNTLPVVADCNLKTQKKVTV